MIADALAGRRIGITGATGFVGTALVERLLRCVPECDLALLVRPGRRTSAAERVRREILRNNCFDRLRSELGSSFDAEMERRIAVMAGDVTRDGLGLDRAGLDLLAGCDVVIHSAATVSFDSPLDAAVDVNLLGPSRVAKAISDARASHPDLTEALPAGEAPREPAHLVSISTAYVSATCKGRVDEELLSEAAIPVGVDWREEVAAARRARSDIDAKSREPEMIARLTRAARSQIGAAGTHLLAERAEKLRQDWVSDRMVRAGISRAHMLGWPDSYAYTKALGEVALLETRDRVPITILRPSIIESSLHEPCPGWIRGFRMGDPVIVSYAKGLLKEFPGTPEGIVDIIPVDLVVAAAITIAAAGPPENGATAFHIASGDRNPLRYDKLVELIRTWFTERPLYDDDGQPILAPSWTFPGRGRVQRQLGRTTKALTIAEKSISALPLRTKNPDMFARLERNKAQAERALGYVELYGAYTETEARFSTRRLIELQGTLAEEDRAVFSFDPATIDWNHYVNVVHLPSVVQHSRVRTSPIPRERTTRLERMRRSVLAPGRRLAIFDLENTLIASNVVDTYAWLASRWLRSDERLRLVASLLKDAPRLLLTDMRDRGDFLRAFYRRYEGEPTLQVQEDCAEMFSDLLLQRVFPEGIRRVRQHRAAGHKTLLVTGSLDLIVEPLRVLFDEVACAKLGTREDGTLSGHLDAPPPTGELRATLIREYAEAEGLSLEDAVAYADSTSDLPMLEVVGNPVIVNPEARLAVIAQRRGWPVERWSRSPGMNRWRLPLAPPARQGERARAQDRYGRSRSWGTR